MLDMFKLAIIATYFLFASGAVFNLPDLEDNDIFNISSPDVKVITIGIPDPIWVLNLNDETLGFEKLQVANKKGEEIFDRVVKPMIQSFRRTQPLPYIRVKKDDPEKNDSEMCPTKTVLKEIKQEIMKIINKFVMSSSPELDSYLPESEAGEGQSLILFFKGPYTSLMLTSGRKEWHYFIGPPSPLPSWFYQKHLNIQRNGDEKFVFIPEPVRDEFYTKLMHMLQMLLGMPV